VPFGILTIAVAWAGVPESRADTRSMDWTGGVLACIALGSIAFALTSLTAAPGPWVVAIAGAAGILFALGFLWHQAVTAAPMMPLRLFLVRAFAGSNGLTFLLYGALSAALFFLPIALIDAHGYSATAAGLALLPFTLVIAALSRFAGGLVDRFGSRLPLTVGPTLTGAGFALMAYAAHGGDFWFAVLPAMLVAGAGMGLTAAPLSTTVMNAVDERQAGVASGINNAVSRTAGLIFVAAFGIVAQAGFALAGASGRFGEPLSAGDAYRAGIVSGFAAVAIGCALFALAAGLVGFLSLGPRAPDRGAAG
jgi:MFS family permease